MPVPKRGKINHIEYLVVDDGDQYPDGAQPLDIQFGSAPFEEWELEDMAQEAAEHDFHQNCGYERYSGSIDSCEFELFIDGKSAGVFEVTVQSVPEFRATRRKATSSEVPL